jgi:hypothetical protein
LPLRGTLLTPATFFEGFWRQQNARRGESSVSYHAPRAEDSRLWRASH